uniref:hypothetical protein n=1 Tax=Lachnoclostridium phocaeense TaxID=1871021 RepID=UPI0026DAE5F9|nr:hypothetical protein [Lachnoclostridium phocaeense]
MEGLAYLVKVMPDHNQNRYYKMIQQGDYFKIEMGRVGARPVTLKRPMALWDTTFHKKLSEGYVDRAKYCDTAYRNEMQERISAIQDQDTRRLWKDLVLYANMLLVSEYTVHYTEVSRQMVETAQSLIDRMLAENNIDRFNGLLMELFQVIPRKMHNVQEKLAKDIKDFLPILEREQELLDVMESQVITGEPEEETEDLLIHLGLDVRKCTQKEWEGIIQHMSDDTRHLCKRAWRIKNRRTEERFHEYRRKNGIHKKEIHSLFHGSRNANYYGLLSQGPKLNMGSPNGHLFGMGLYFATNSAKSIRYTSTGGYNLYCRENMPTSYLAVYKVAYRNPLHVNWPTDAMSQWRKKDILPHDAVFAHGGNGSYLVNNEIIVYDEAAVTIKYLLELEK